MQCFHYLGNFCGVVLKTYMTVATWDDAKQEMMQTKCVVFLLVCFCWHCWAHWVPWCPVFCLHCRFCVHSRCPLSLNNKPSNINRTQNGADLMMSLHILNFPSEFHIVARSASKVKNVGIFRDKTLGSKHARIKRTTSPSDLAALCLSSHWWIPYDSGSCLHPCQRVWIQYPKRCPTTRDLWRSLQLV